MTLTDRLSANALRLGAAFVTAAAVTTAGVVAVLPSAGASTAGQTHAPGKYVFATYDNNGDNTFNQLLGINDNDEITGYFGSGAARHPNQGYTLMPPYSQPGYTAENFPGALQTQVTGLNNAGVTVGFFSNHNTTSMMNDNEGFIAADHSFTEVNFPTSDPASPPVDQLLGINGHGVAVGFYTNGHGFNRSYSYNITTHKYARVTEPGHPGASITATGINGAGFISGFYATRGTTEGFIEIGRHFTTLAVPGSSATLAFGIDNRSEVVGAYTVGSGSKALTHGFTWTRLDGFATVDDPRGKGTTFINGVNSAGDLVGFYTDKAGNTDGFLAIPTAPQVKTVRLQSMPAGHITFGMGSGGVVTVNLTMTGLTPGSQHFVELWGPHGKGLLTTFGTATADSLGHIKESAPSTFTGTIPDGSRLVVLNGQPIGQVGKERIAQTGLLNGASTHFQIFKLTSVEISPSGKSYGTPAGQATLTYNPAAKTLTVTVTATGLTPGAHAAHVHAGSCADQGGVLYMLMDFVANRHGQISGQTRVVTGVTAPLPVGGWYLNLHQGTSNTILSNGMPTIAFRPLLCSNV